MNGTPESTTTSQEPRLAAASPTMQAMPAPAAPAWIKAQDPRAKSPALAGFLSLMPGLGQVYVGYYKRGFVHCVVVASIITFLASMRIEALAPLAGVFLAFFWMYNIIDAARRAAQYNQFLAGQGEIELPDDTGFRFGGSLVGGTILIVIGSLLLLHTRFDLSLEWLEEWWPAAPILVGVYLVGKAIQDRRS